MLSTVILSVAGSRIASDPREAASWLVAIGAACLMFLADSHREFEVAAHDLAQTGLPIRMTRRDVVRDHHDRAHAAALLLAIVAILGGLLAPLGAPYLSWLPNPIAPAAPTAPSAGPSATATVAPVTPSASVAPAR